MTRARYIDQHVNFDQIHHGQFSFEQGLAVLEGALAIGRQAGPFVLELAAERLEAVRALANPECKPSFLPAVLRAWLRRCKTSEAKSEALAEHQQQMI